MRVAVFGRPGGGKSTLSQRIATDVELPLFQVDLLRFETGGTEIPAAEFAARCADVLAQPRWVLDGFASPATFEATISRASALVYVDRPMPLHYWWVTKRFLLSPIAKPIGWPEKSPMWTSTLASYRFLRLSDRFWSKELEVRLLAYRPGKQVHVVRSASDERLLLQSLKSVAGNQ